MLKPRVEEVVSLNYLHFTWFSSVSVIEGIAVFPRKKCITGTAASRSEHLSWNTQICFHTSPHKAVHMPLSLFNSTGYNTQAGRITKVQWDAERSKIEVTQTERP